MVDPRIDAVARRLHNRYRRRGQSEPWSKLSYLAKEQLRRDAQFYISIVEEVSSWGRPAANHPAGALE